jgi:membrane-bound serine protease (ClpP class)
MTWIIGLLIMAVLLAAAEVIVPGGVLGLLAIAAIGVASWLAFAEDGVAAAAITFTLGSLAAMIAALAMLPLAQRFGAGNIFALRERVRGTSRSSSGEKAPSVVGKRGSARTTMAPTGVVEIDGQEFEGSSQSGLLNAGEPVEVVKQDSYRVVVRKASP